jgi:uncharacterized protein (DUF1330 family)
VIYEAEVINPGRYEDYRAKTAASLATAGARYIVRSGDMEVLEGESPAGRIVIAEFPTMESALAW